MSDNTLRVFTIGYSGKSAETFFSALEHHHVKRIIDIRLKNTSQMAGYTKKDDIRYFLSLHEMDYIHLPECAPDEELLTGYKAGSVSWDEYVNRYHELMRTREIPALQEGDCLLCSEASPEHCHRRVLAEMIPGVVVHHIIVKE